MLAPSSTNDVQHFPESISTSRRCKYCPSEGNSSSPSHTASSYTSSSFPTCSSPSSTDQEIKIIQGRTYSSKNLHRIYCTVTGTHPPATMSRLFLILLFSYFLLILISVYLTYVCHSLCRHSVHLLGNFRPSVYRPSVHRPSVHRPSVHRPSVHRPSVHRHSVLYPFQTGIISCRSVLDSPIGEFNFLLIG